MENLFFDRKDLKYCGENVIIGKTVRIRKPHLVSIGDHTIIDDFTYIPCEMEIGRYVHICANVSFIGGPGKVTMGDFSAVGPGSQLITGSNNYKGGGLGGAPIPAEFAAEAIVEPIEIGEHVLLGCHTAVLPGAVLPEGLATGVFTLLSKKEYQTWTLYTGIPARKHADRDGSRILREAEKLRGERIG